MIRNIRTDLSLLHDSILIVIAHIVNVISSFLTIAIASRRFTADEFGLWSMFSSIMVFGTLMDFGLRSAMGNRLSATVDLNNSKHDIKSRNFFLSILYVKLYIVCFCIFIIIALAPFFSFASFIKTSSINSVNSINELFYITMVVSLLSMPFTSSTYVLLAYREIKTEALLSVIQSLLLVFIFFYIQSIKYFEFYEITIFYFIVYLALWIGRLVYVFLKRKWSVVRIPFKEQINHLKSIWHVSIDFFFLHASANIMSNAGVFLSGILVNLSGAGLFNVLNKMFNLLTMLHLSFLSSFGPYFTRDAYMKEWEKIQWRLKMNLFVIVPFFFILIGFVLWAVHPIILTLWTGIKFESYVIAGVMVVTSIFCGWGNTYSFLLNSLGIVRMQAFLSICTALLYIFVASIMADKIGISGVALAQLFITVPGVIILTVYAQSAIEKKLINI